MDNNNLYLSFGTFYSLALEQFTMDVDISENDLIDRLSYISKDKNYRDINLYEWVLGAENSNRLMNNMDSSMKISQLMKCSLDIVLDDILKEEKKRIIKIAYEFLSDLAKNVYEQEKPHVKVILQEDRYNIFLFHFVFFFSLYKDLGQIRKTLKLDYEYVKSLSIYCDVKKNASKGFNKLVELDQANKLYSSTIFTLFNTVPIKLEKYHISMYHYNLAIIQYKFSYCIVVDENEKFSFDNNRNKLPSSPRNNNIVEFLKELKNSMKYDSFCAELGKVAQNLPFSIASETNIGLSNNEYGRLIMDRLNGEKSSSANKLSNNMIAPSQKRVPRYLSTLKTIIKDNNSSYNLTKSNGSKLTLPDIATLIFFHECTIPIICLPKDPRTTKKSSNNDIYKLKTSKIKLHELYMTKLYNEIVRNNILYIKTNELELN